MARVTSFTFCDYELMKSYFLKTQDNCRCVEQRGMLLNQNIYVCWMVAKRY